MIAVEESNAGFFAVLAQEFLDEKVVLVSPMPFAPELPAIDEIADDVESFTLGLF